MARSVPALLIIVLLSLGGCIPQTVIHSAGTMTDPRDGDSYRTVLVNEQEWMAENLRFKADSSWCFNNDENLCEIMGRYYEWETALKVCPDGWRLPGKSDVKKLYDALGGSRSAGLKMKSVSGWRNNSNGRDEFGLNLQPSGYRHYDGSFAGDSCGAYLWTSDEKYDRESLTWGASCVGDNGDIYHDYKEQGYSVRCMRDRPLSERTN